MKKGEVIYARTHAEFLNKVFGTNYKAWMKCTWKYDYDTIVWMVRFNEKDGGWRNTFVSKTRIQEENLEKGRTNWDRALSDLGKKRIVIEIDDEGMFRKYIFRGIYAYDEKNSDPYTSRYYDQISEVL